MRVELEVFSGRTNPVWHLDDSQVREALDRFSGRSLAEPADLPDQLGFRGLVISADTDDPTESELPQRFAVGVAQDSRDALTADESVDAVSWLLETSRHHVDDQIREHVMRALRGNLESRSIEAKADLQPAAPCQPYHTPYNPGFWNNDATVRTTNNCYNYAVNRRTNTFAQPGRQCGHQYTSLTCAAVRAAALCDGVRPSCDGQQRLVALVVWPGGDYHWYRYHSDGFWGHKPGKTAARNTDNSGNVIGGSLNPANCNRGPYTQFCGYFWVPVGLLIR
ncbi:hypothetical protein NLX83_26165 [Allokutzneria sp. A3M-2-11 16]|uniref:hypothetical protein n=1 Tax=Allokutzneria sp. A3M-2-11 16 TaxID=2962043 RepID=UPI0020B86E6D|nr:hypothetical protein [Allokutzneria sp. A3M-2-11 16]MCP3802764.1 hypothetical protein [Allokutzneria sp. A3M-2-11 16]